MSIVSTLFSSRSSSRINARIIFLMDNLLAIGFGLGLRFVVNTTSPHDFRLASTLIGLWEGVVTLHFLKKMPKSPDPYIAYGVRLFVDFVATENLARLVLVIIWTGLGMVLADIAPAIWHDVGAHRIWRRFRRDMYYISRSVPPLPSIPPLFPRARVVRFSPVIEPTEISETISTLSPTAATPTTTTTRIIPPPSSVPRATKRPVPGNFARSVVSETDTETPSALGLRQGADPSAAGTPHTRYTIRPRRSSIDSGSTRSPLSSVGDSNTTSDASSVSTETPSQVVEIVEEEEIEVAVRSRDKGKGKERAVEKGDPDTPIQRSFELPPTPSDSNRPHLNRRPSFVPTISGMPSIPDFFESGLGSDWENVKEEDAQDLPSQPMKDLDSPPARYIPPPSTYEPTPRPTTFDQDLWDDVSNAAPPTPYKRTSPKQRASRLPSRIPIVPAKVPTIPKPVRRKRKSDPPPPPPVPQTPLYGSAWDTEADRLPPPTPSVLARTPIHEPTFGLNNNDDNDAGAPPVDLNTAHPVDSENQEPIYTEGQEPSQPPDAETTQQGVADTSTGFDNPWDDPSPLPPQGDEQQRETQSQDQDTLPPVPPTPQFKHRPSAPPTPGQQSRTVPPTPSQRPGTVPHTPGPQPVPVPPTPGQRAGTVPQTPSLHSGQIPPTPGLRSGSIPQTPGLRSGSVPQTPSLHSGQIPPTPGLRSGQVPQTPGLHSGQIPPTPGLRSGPVPPTPQQQPGTVPLAQEEQQQESQSSMPQSKSKVPPTPQQQSQTIPSTPQQPLKNVPGTPLQQSKPVPPTPQVKPKTPPTATPQQRTKPIPPTPQQQTKPVPSTPQQPIGNILPTPQQRMKSVPPTPQPPSQPILPTPQPLKESQGMFDDIMDQINDLGRTPAAETKDPITTQQTQLGGDLVDLAGDDNAAEGGQSGLPEDNGGNVNENNGNEHAEEFGAGDDPTNAGPTGEGEPVQFDEHNNPLSPASSGYSSVAGVPSEIKERNKQAIIIRAQIAELEKTIEELKAEKLRAEGKEELDPLSEESTLKGQEIQKAERSLEKLKKRAMKRHQAAVDSTQLLTLPKELKLNLEGMSTPNGVTRLEDVLGLYFAPEQKSLKVHLSFPKGGPGKPMKEAVTKVFEEYGIKTFPKVGGVTGSMVNKAYLDMVTTFRQKHAKADDS